jgi:murein L,D-transpeptidase YcbB/YkuD
VIRKFFVAANLLGFALFGAPGAWAGALDDAIRQQLHSGANSRVSEQDVEDRATLARFYDGRAMAPLWVSDQGVTDRGMALARALGAAESDGLNPADYDAAAISALLSATTAAALADLEVRLSVGLVQMASDLASGRLAPNKVDPEFFVYPADIDHGEVIRNAAEAPDIAGFLAGFRPAQPEYERLRQALADYRALAVAGGWKGVPPGETLKPGMTDPRIGLLRARLAVTGDIDRSAPAPQDPNFYDEDLINAVVRFQYRHGLEQDGKVGKMTVEALNVPVEARIRQMLLNAERRRWMPDDRGERYVFVNLADFVLKVVDGPKTIFDTRVVVGTPYHRSPVFSHKMTYIVVNPYWTVPPSIARKELLPKIRKDPGYLAANNFTLFSDWSDGARVVDPFSVDWSQVSARSFGYKIRQGSGEGNALGRLKFMFPNRHNIYLHDTPAKALFAKTQRSFSHGCIRVEHPDELAAVLLSKQPDWSLDQIRRSIKSDKRTIVSLAEPLPVHLTYLTAWVNKDGSVHFRDDIYGRDAILAKVLLGPGQGI